MARSEKLEQDELGSKKDYSNRTEQEKMDQLRSMKLHVQFERDTDDKKSGRVWKMVQKWRFGMANRKLVVSSTEASLNQLG